MRYKVHNEISCLANIALQATIRPTLIPLVHKTYLAHSRNVSVAHKIKIVREKNGGIVEFESIVIFWNQIQYECDKCGKIFCNRSKTENHLKRKFSCNLKKKTSSMLRVQCQIQFERQFVETRKWNLKASDYHAKLYDIILIDAYENCWPVTHAYKLCYLQLKESSFQSILNQFKHRKGYNL